MSAKLIEINGHRLYVVERNPHSAPAVVLLHHGLGTQRAWRAQVPFLAKMGLRVIAYDRWGYGQSDPREKLSMPHFEDDQADLLGLLDRLENKRVALVGHSDGGTIALYIAARHPERVSALVTLAAHIYVEEKMVAGLQQVYRQYQTDVDFQARLRRRQGSNNNAVISGWYGGWFQAENRSWDMRPELAKITCPTLVMQGVKDEHATPQHAIDLAGAITNAELVLLPKAGHMLPRENAREVNRRLSVFLREGLRQERLDVQ